MYCFLLFICVRLTRDLINATYLLTYFTTAGNLNSQDVTVIVQRLTWRIFCLAKFAPYKCHY